MAHKLTFKAQFRLLRLVVLLSAVAMLAMRQGATPAGLYLTMFSSHARRHGSEGSQDQGSVKLATELVSVRVTVTDQSGRSIEGLSKDNFKIYEDKVEQPVSFFSDEDTPASIGVVFDTSNSMSGDKIMRAKEALARFIQTSHEQDEYFLISFSSSAQLLLDGTWDCKAVLDQFNNAHPKGETALYDAVYLGVEKVSQGAHPKRAIILISDGEDNHSRRSFDDLRQRLQESDITIYSLGIAGNYPSPKSRATADGPFLMDKLASISGGKSFWPGNPEKMEEAFERLALELRRQYSIGYLPSNFVADGKWRRITVTVTTPRDRPRLIVRSREGYYAVKNPDDGGANSRARR
jgi:Ca-activated chloride channel family protein